MKNQIRLTITQEDINKAIQELKDYNMYLSCPVFQALKRKNYNVQSVGFRYAIIDNNDYELSSPLARQVADYTYTKSFKPGIYYLYLITETDVNLR